MKGFGGFLLGFGAALVIFKVLPAIAFAMEKADAAHNPEIHNDNPVQPDDPRNPHPIGPKQTRPGWESNSN